MPDWLAPRAPAGPYKPGHAGRAYLRGRALAHARIPHGKGRSQADCSRRRALDEMLGACVTLASAGEEVWHGAASPPGWRGTVLHAIRRFEEMRASIARGIRRPVVGPIYHPHQAGEDEVPGWISPTPRRRLAAHRDLSLVPAADPAPGLIDDGFMILRRGSSTTPGSTAINSSLDDLIDRGEGGEHQSTGQKPHHEPRSCESKRGLERPSRIREAAGVELHAGEGASTSSSRSMHFFVGSQGRPRPTAST